MKGNHEETWVPVKTGRGETQVHVLPGQFIFGRKTAAKELNMDTSNVRNRMKKLKTIGNVDMQPDTHYTIVTIINWGSYQVKEEKKDRQVDTQRTPKGHPKDRQVDTDKKNKNEKNEKKKETPLPPWLNSQAWNDYKEHRKSLKFKMTPRAEELAIKKLEKFKTSGNDPTDVICQSIEMGWKGLFEIKGNNKKGIISGSKKSIKNWESGNEK